MAPDAPLHAALVSAAQPFSVGRVLSRTLSIWARNAVPFAVVTLVVHAPAFALALSRGPRAALAGRPDLVQTLVDNLLGLVTAGALTYGVLLARRGERPRVGALLSVGLRRFGSIFLTSLGVGLLFAVGTLALVIPGIVAYVGLYVAVPVAVAEPGLASTKDVLRRSWELTRGRRVQVFAVVLVAFIALFLFAGTVGAVIAATMGWAPWWVAFAVVRICIAIGAGVFNTAPAVAYHDLRVEKEGVSTDDLVKVFE